MGLIRPGYLPNTYFPDRYWVEDYWVEFGVKSFRGESSISEPITSDITYS